MKEVKLLDCVQAVIPPNNNLILATIQEHNLKNELDWNNYYSALSVDNEGCVKFVMRYPFL